MFSQFLNTNPNLELWWDSPPKRLISWYQQLIDCDSTILPIVLKNLEELFGSDLKFTGIFTGCTSNPRLVFNTIIENEQYWTNLFRKNNARGKYWESYKFFFKENAKYLLPIWLKTEGKFGWVNAQVTPCSVNNAELMLQQGVELSKCSPNIMIKIPGSKEGYQALESLTSLGISTNNTLTFSISQFQAYLIAIKKGLERAQYNGVKLQQWRSVFTFMIGRFGEEAKFYEQAIECGIYLTKSDIRWAEHAIYKRIEEAIKSESTQVKLLLCSLKHEFQDNIFLCDHLKYMDYSNIIYTFPPQFLAPLISRFTSTTINIETEIEKNIPTSILQKLLRIPYFERAYEPNGIKKEDFCNQPAFLKGFSEINNAYLQTVELLEKTKE